MGVTAMPYRAVFEAEGWTIYINNLGQAYGSHIGCGGDALDGSNKTFIKTSWLSDDDEYEGYTGARCYGCMIAVPEGIQALIVLNEWKK